MKKSRFIESQFIAILKENYGGLKFSDIRYEYDIDQVTLSTVEYKCRNIIWSAEMIDETRNGK